MFFGEEVNASFPLDFSDFFSPLSAPFQRFPAKPSLPLRKQRPVQNPTTLKVYFGIFEMFSGLSNLYHPLCAPGKIPVFPFAYSKLCTAISSTWIV